MTQAAKSAGSSEQDLVDRIAEALPLDIRADFYRELRHCRSLPDNDEMLRILRIMQFLTLLIHEAPSRLAVERESLENGLTGCAEALDRTTARLDSLPREISSGIAPDVIAAKINESLRQQFIQSTMPQTAEALAVVASQLKRGVGEFQQAATLINCAHRNAASEASQAIAEMESNISRASKAAQQATADLKSTFLHEYRWSIGMIAAVAMLVGFLLAWACMNWTRSPIEQPPPPVEVHKQKR